MTPINLSLVTDLPRSVPLFDLLTDFSDDIAQATGGQLQINVFAQGELVSAFEVTDAVLAGQAAMGWTLAAIAPGNFPGFRGFDVPLGASLGADASQAAWRTIQEGGFDPDGLDVLATSFAGDTVIGFTSVNPPTSFDSLKLRAVGRDLGETLTDLDAAVVNIPANQLRNALEVGVIDGMVTSGLQSAALNTDSVFRSLVNDPEGRLIAPQLRTLIVNDDLLANLPENLRAILLDRTGEALSGVWGDRIATLEQTAISGLDLDATPIPAALLSELNGALDTNLATALTPEESAVRAAFAGENETFPVSLEEFVVIVPTSLGATQFTDLDDASFILGMERVEEQAFFAIAFRIIGSIQFGSTLDLEVAVQRFLAGERDALVFTRESFTPALRDQIVAGGITGVDVISGQDLTNFDFDSASPTNGADILFGTGGADVIDGLAGNDTIDGLAGNDTLAGGTGDDSISGGANFDVIFAGAGNDTVAGDDGRDEVFLGAGNDLFLDNAQGGALGRDTVAAGTGDDTIEGGNGDDVFFGETGADIINGRLGNDSLYGGDGFDTISAGAGNDLVFGGNGRDLVFLNQGNDLFVDNAQGGVLGRDTVFTGLGDDTVEGGNGDDVFYGEDGNDLINGRLGNDTIFGGNNFDTISAGAGNDVVYGGNGRDLIFLNQGDDLYIDNAQGGVLGRDTVFTGLGNDTVQGGNGDDLFFGEAGSDLLLGRLGNDTLQGGTGADTLNGGGGADTFIFAATDVGLDIVQDFEVGLDAIRLLGTGADRVSTALDGEQITIIVDGQAAALLQSADDLSGYGVSDILFS